MSLGGLKGGAPPTKPEGRGAKLARLALAEKEETDKNSREESEEAMWVDLDLEEEAEMKEICCGVTPTHPVEMLL